MTTIAGPVLGLAIDASAARRGAQEFAEACERARSAGSRASGGVDDLGRNFGKLPSQISPANAALTGFFAGFTASITNRAIDFLVSLAGQVIETGDAYQRLDARLTMVTGSMAEGARAHADLYAMSQRLGVGFQATGGFFTRIASQSKELGLSYEDLLKVTESLEGAFKVGGASAEETSRAMMQLGQAFGSGKLQGEEFRSVAENAPIVLDLLSRALGVTRGELMEMARNGDLTAQTLAQGLLKIAPQIEREVQTMGTTVAEETTKMMNAWGELLSAFAKTSGASDAAKQAIQAVTAFLESDAGKGAVQDFAGAVSDLIQMFQTLVSMGQPVADMLNSAVSKVQSAGESISKYTSIVSDARRSLERAGGFMTGGGFGGEYPKEGQSGFDFQRPPMWHGETPTGFDAAGGVTIKEFQLGEEVQGAKIPQPAARPRAPGYRMQEIEAPKGGRRGGGAKAEPKLDLESGKAFEDSAFMLGEAEDAVMRFADLSSNALTKTQQDAIDTLKRIQQANLQAHGDQTKIIEQRRDEELNALKLVALSSEDAAKARVLVEDTAAQQILDIRRRAAGQIAGLEEENLQTRAGASFGEERTRLQAQLVQMQRDQDTARVQQDTSLLDTEKSRMQELIADTAAQRLAIIDPEPWEQVSRSLMQFGENLTSVEGMTQGVIQGLSTIGATASAAFADAIVSGESFEDTLEALGKSLERMIIQMTMQMLMQQAIGGAAYGLGAWMGPGAGAGGTAWSPAEGGGTFGGQAATMAKGGVIQSAVPHGVYHQPTLVVTQRPVIQPFAKGDVVSADLDEGVYHEPTLFHVKEPGFHAAARGIGLLGEAGPEAVLPLTRTSTGELGIMGVGDKPASEVILPLTRTTAGILGVTTPPPTKAVTQSATSAGSQIKKFAVGGVLTPITIEEAAAETGDINQPYIREAAKSIVSWAAPERPTYSGMTENSVRTFAHGAVLESGDVSVPAITYSHIPFISYHPTSAPEQSQITAGAPAVEPTEAVKGIAIHASLPAGVYRQPTYFPLIEGGIRSFAKGASLTPAVDTDSSASFVPVAPRTATALPLEHEPPLGLSASPRIKHESQGHQVATIQYAADAKRFAVGDVVHASVAHGIYVAPTYFPIEQPGRMAYARGGIGLMAEAGPEAVLPLTRARSGELGVRGVSKGDRQESILPLARSSTGHLGVVSPAYLDASEHVTAKFAKGAALNASLPLGVYSSPTYFEMDKPGFHAFAKGGVAGNAPDDAVLPLVRTPTGQLGVASAGGGEKSGSVVNVTVNNNSKATVTTEQKDNDQGGKDIILTIADQVENIVAQRMMRSGTRVNRSVSSVGAVVAR